jgi:hypothetical protein
LIIEGSFTPLFFLYNSGMNFVNYIHFLGFTPKYVGEGTTERSKKLSNRSAPYGDWLSKHRDEHICILIVSNNSDKVASLLNEQGTISWLGRKWSKEGTLYNLVPYGTGTLGVSPEKRKEHSKKAKEWAEENPEILSKAGKISSETRRRRSFNKNKELGKMVQSLWLRSKAQDSNPFHCGKPWGYALLKKCLGEFSIQIYRNVVKGVDYGGSETLIDDTCFTEFLQMVQMAKSIRYRSHFKAKGKTS